MFKYKLCFNNKNEQKQQNESAHETGSKQFCFFLNNQQQYRYRIVPGADGMGLGTGFIAQGCFSL